MASEIKDEFSKEEAVDIEIEASETEKNEDVQAEDATEDEAKDDEALVDEAKADEASLEEDTPDKDPGDETPSDAASDEASSEETSTDDDAPDKSQKKGLFGKKKEKKDKRDEKIEELTDLLKRNMAEFDNFRKRTEKEKSTMYEIGARSIVEKLLPIVDNFERGLATVSEEDKEKDSFANGMDLVYKQILKLFEELGVEVIETEGKEFDPNLHNAVMHVDDENLGENMIAQEFQKGYTYKGTVIRHSMVQVAN